MFCVNILNLVLFAIIQTNILVVFPVNTFLFLKKNAFKKRRNIFNTWVSSRGQRKKWHSIKKYLSKSPVASKALKLPLILKNDYMQ